MTGSDSHFSRRAVLGSTALLLTATSGCVSTGLSVKAGLSNSKVFKDVSLMESWSSNRAAIKVTLTKQATVKFNVRNISVINASGSSVWTGTVDAAQTSLSNVMVPVGKQATLAAADGSYKFVEKIPITVTGNTFP